MQIMQIYRVSCHVRSCACTGRNLYNSAYSAWSGIKLLLLLSFLLCRFILVLHKSALVLFVMRFVELAVDLGFTFALVLGKAEAEAFPIRHLSQNRGVLPGGVTYTGVQGVGPFFADALLIRLTN